jgi:hypothetical protein
MYNFTYSYLWSWFQPEPIKIGQVPVVESLVQAPTPTAAQITESTYSTLGPYTNWLLKHYSTYTDPEGFFGYRDSMDRDVMIKQILDHWLSDQGIDSTSTAEE